MATIYLTLEQILVIHEDQIVRYGGSSGLRDLSLLESAAFRPQSTFGGKDLYQTIFQKAAALIYSLINNHAFLDANKRTGTVSTLVFLEFNHYRLEVSQKQLVAFARKVEEKVLSLEDIAAWLKKHSRKLT